MRETNKNTQANKDLYIQSMKNSRFSFQLSLIFEINMCSIERLTWKLPPAVWRECNANGSRVQRTCLPVDGDSVASTMEGASSSVETSIIVYCDTAAESDVATSAVNGESHVIDKVLEISEPFRRGQKGRKPRGPAEASNDANRRFRIQNGFKI